MKEKDCSPPLAGEEEDGKERINVLFPPPDSIYPFSPLHLHQIEEWFLKLLSRALVYFFPYTTIDIFPTSLIIEANCVWNKKSRALNILELKVPV
ncbi:hypothetical protein TNIN_292061 [Trichonephila inaurata madagascariensis]|uniref:Uncharacterized protein n=1 Tax=Trichonephila inaurata madagascariensis TaxID=2747483 RepID=A0A8X6M5Q7_9ARAC|nr:hypothetical protein TNIN_292061 [Trichonephila inaurata madagascariensis]